MGQIWATLSVDTSMAADMALCAARRAATHWASMEGLRRGGSLSAFDTCLEGGAVLPAALSWPLSEAAAATCALPSITILVRTRMMKTGLHNTNRKNSRNSARGRLVLDSISTACHRARRTLTAAFVTMPTFGWSLRGCWATRVPRCSGGAKRGRRRTHFNTADSFASREIGPAGAASVSKTGSSSERSAHSRPSIAQFMMRAMFTPIWLSSLCSTRKWLTSMSAFPSAVSHSNLAGCLTCARTKSDNMIMSGFRKVMMSKASIPSALLATAECRMRLRKSIMVLGALSSAIARGKTYSRMASLVRSMHTPPEQIPIAQQEHRSSGSLNPSAHTSQTNRTSWSLRTKAPNTSLISSLRTACDSRTSA
mmetsp:Transcript_11947/g.34063  ORF Transcript_11947/g.34063 Transcript_11947/m.34063 type:complete len:367 (-) Transcript_11947:165-1265(-)